MSACESVYPNLCECLCARCGNSASDFKDADAHFVVVGGRWDDCGLCEVCWHVSGRQVVGGRHGLARSR